ncbi:MAG: hypothetical protein CMJ18_15270 [Phycisphaeraceae bacterium]|nr:hypothetical protein [Phycisphaeraceae bacterium]
MKFSRFFKKRRELGDWRAPWRGLETLEARLLMSADALGAEVLLNAAAVEASATAGGEQTSSVDAVIEPYNSLSIDSVPVETSGVDFGAATDGNSLAAQSDIGIWSTADGTFVVKADANALVPGIIWGTQNLTDGAGTRRHIPVVALLLPAVNVIQPVDHEGDAPARMYVTGASMGGFGTWEVIQRAPEDGYQPVDQEVGHDDVVQSTVIWGTQNLTTGISVGERRTSAAEGYYTEIHFVSNTMPV